MPTKHLPIGGSTIARTMACPAWLHLSKDAPKQSGSNEFADTGTLLHNCMEEMYGDAGAHTFGDMLIDGREYNGIELTDEMIVNKLKPAFTAVESICDELNIDTLTLEPFVELVPDQAGGSIDVIAVSECGADILVLDYKFGHVSVLASENKQLLFYGLCAAVDPETALMYRKAERITFAIVQPNDVGVTLDTWACKIGVLDGFEDEVYRAIDIVESITSDETAAPHTKAGEHCRYCPALPTCPKKTGVAEAALRLNPADAVSLNANMAMVSELEQWCKAVKKQAHEQLELGVKLADWKLVAKRASRVWTDSDTVQKKIRSNKKLTVADTHEAPKLMSPAKLEKVLAAKGFDKDYFAAYYASVSSGNTIAHRDDKRAEITQAPTAEALAALRDKL